MRLFASFTTAYIWILSSPLPAQSIRSDARTLDFRPLSPAEKYEWQLRRATRPLRWAGWAAGAGIAQWRDVPEEWEQGMSGYGRRYGAALALSGTRNLLFVTTNVALGTDPRYHRSTASGFGPRVRHAVKATFLSRKDDGGTMVAIPRFTAAYGSAFLATSWLPPSRSGVDRALTRGSIVIGLDIVNNLFAEFSPDLFRKLRRKNQGKN